MWLHTEITSLADIPRHYARTAGDRVALMSATRKMSWRELDLASNRLANLLIARGVPPGGIVAFFGKNSIEYFIAIFGANKAGCALLPLNWRLAAPEQAAVLQDARPQTILVDAEYAEALRQAIEAGAPPAASIAFDSAGAQDTELADGLAQCSDADPRLAIRPEDTALLLYTSGTTGQPKGVQLTHGGLNYMRLCEHLEPSLAWRPDDIMMLVMPNFHMVGTGLSLQGLYNGVPLTILPAFEAGSVLAAIERDKATVCCLVPTTIQMLIDHPDAAKADLSSLRLIMYAGSPITAGLLGRAIQTIHCDFMQFYGATESGGAITLLRPEQHDLAAEKKLKSCGSPVPLIEVKVVSPSGDTLPDGKVGEFLVRSPTLFKGYLNKPELTRAAFSDGWYMTGDAGYRDQDGLLYLVDRTKDMIITGGENVYSTEVESAISKHPGVSQVAVIGLPDSQWGERVVAIVVPAADACPTAEDIIAHCRRLIAAYKAPKQVVFANHLPMTPSGKILKATLRKQFREMAET